MGGRSAGLEGRRFRVLVSVVREFCFWVLPVEDIEKWVDV